MERGARTTQINVLKMATSSENIFKDHKGR
jgi:hypothetical protein